MRKFIYIKLRHGYAQARVVGKIGDSTFTSEALSHPRTIVGNHEVLVALFKKFIRTLTGLVDRVIRPKVLIHLVEPSTGGYTTSELYVLRVMAQVAGAGGTLLCNDDFGPQPDSELKKLA